MAWKNVPIGDWTGDCSGFYVLLYNYPCFSNFDNEKELFICTEKYSIGDKEITYFNTYFN